ncbi:hypothetical protein CEUSTIGMA_g1336.t1 [Chlamydomonas eustigma]|uniref:valine--tRNA ligase n=1 Tax=Chlamydomonas eustigma TaxID=1157962 RepID=A0A250WT12_9CHLO|nr:hypothetical protein CEUSTIGMA_g1336.t1 [Chlamydomonas eustigma]|eukprot:GAX73886.1 hypothetical protein CEUSTIGMA_g1336.t1 [Chlamydomonas eustigma]
MALRAPPGHFAQSAALIASELAGLSLVIDPPDDAVQDVSLSIQNDSASGMGEILKLVSLKAPTHHLYPSQHSEEINSLLSAANALGMASKPWVDAGGNADIEAQNTSKQAIIASLNNLEGKLVGKSYMVGSSVTIADIATAAALAPLLTSVMGATAREPYPEIMRWFTTLCKEPQFTKILGDVKLCSSSDSWVVPSRTVPAKNKKKKGSGADGPEVSASASRNEQAESAQDADLDPEKAAKKAAKLAEKAAKDAKFAAKQAALSAKQAAAAEKGSNDKKATLKAEAEAKKKAEADEVLALLVRAQATPNGEKKDTSPDTMCKTYHPKVVETAWYEWWETCGFFKPEPHSSKPPFVIVIPPPNVTGALHIGHALTNAIQDTIVRWRRMSGFNALWVPGTDHAGIATQTVVEKKLQREKGVTRHQLGREAFLTEVWKWVDEYGGRICDQLRRIGSSVDWSRKAFTMDDNLSRAVLEAFVRMHEQGCIYRDNRLVNWCCRLKTAVSDIEVDYIDIPKRTLLSVPGYEQPVEFGVITSFAYLLEDGSGEIVVATTRPETMLGDTAVAVHPEDPRYTSMHGKFVIHPVDGRRIPIICDAELVDMSFGTGAVKVTPAHDPNDFMTGKRHNLEFINIFDDNGLINDRGGSFKGQPRFKTRIEIVEFLRSKDLFRGTADNAMRLGLCSRSKDVIEPVLKPQWWVSCKDMAAKSCAAVRDGTLEIIPKEFEPVWFRWLENIRDWCISRQLWWGHRIPAYYVTLEADGEGGSGGSPGMPSENMERWVVGRTEEEARRKAEHMFPGKVLKLTQDEDVLDTWFSSGLFPFSVFQWPQQTEDLKAFYPGQLLETGHDILFFWVARMVMMGIQLTGQVPFKQVYLHAMVRDAHGRKMSKSLGNVIDPLHVIEGISLEELHNTVMGGNLDAKEVDKAIKGQKEDFPEGIEECGTDALRFALCAYTTQARDINLDIKRVVSYRHWCNKLWNAIKFAMMNLPEGFQPPLESQLETARPSYPLPSQWILSRLNGAVTAIVKAMESYDFATATQIVYAFWQYDLCDVFIELMKPVVALDDAVPGAIEAKLATRNTLWVCLETGLRLLHPFMPFVTEELWQRLPKPSTSTPVVSIMLADYPSTVVERDAPSLERDFEYVQTVITRTRKMRTDYGLVKQKPMLFVSASDAGKHGVLSSFSSEVATLTSSADITVLGPGVSQPAGCSVAIVDESTTVYMLLAGVLDPVLEIQKLQKKVSEVEGRIDVMKKKMLLPNYDKTPDNVKADDQEKLSKAEAELSVATSAVQDFQALLS